MSLPLWRVLGLSAAGTAVVVVSSCAGRLNGNESSYRVDRAELGCATDLFQQRCASEFCHDSRDPTGSLDLASVGYRSRLVGVPASDPSCADRLLIDPAAPEKSFLLEKVSSPNPQCGAPMPLSGAPLSPDELACLRSWIAKLLGLDGGALGGGPDAAATRDGSSPARGDASTPHQDASTSHEDASVPREDASTPPRDGSPPDARGTPAADSGSSDGSSTSPGIPDATSDTTGGAG